MALWSRRAVKRIPSVALRSRRAVERIPSVALWSRRAVERQGDHQENWQCGGWCETCRCECRVR